MTIKAGLFRCLALTLSLFLAGCAGAPGEGETEEEVGSIAQATTEGSCLSAPLAGECRYAPVQAYASSVESSSSSLIPANAIDSSCATRWSSAFSDPQWLKVDLGTKRPVSRLIIHWETAASSNYEIQVSDDASTWTKVATKANANITGSGNSRVDTIAGLTATARYVRVYSLARTTSYGNSVFELEVFGTGCGAPPGCSQTPVFPVGAAASSIEHSEKGPEKAIDGSMSTRWSSAASDPQWLRLDLGQSQSISRVVLDWEAASSNKYDLQVSEATTGPWTTIASRTDARVGPRTDDLPNLVGTGRYLRINSTKRNTTYGNSLYEVKVYRQSCDACDQVLKPTTTTASSAESSTYAASKATDGDLASRWSSNFSDPQWLLQDFGQERRIKQVTIKWEGAASKSYRLEGATSASGPWTTIVERTNQPAGPRVDYIKDISTVARYLRVYSTARTSTYGNSIYEIFVQGAANPLACGGDCAFGDTDKDTVNDCFDQCPSDPTKTTPGMCGCGVPDDDVDNDGVPGCKDRCKNYPDDQALGDCGCPDAPKPAGTKCNDGPCPGSSVCDGVGHCGSASACPVAPNCVTKQVDDHWYWFCPGNYTWQDARQRCANVQGNLVIADSSTENAFVAQNLIGSSAWIGANDLTVDGQWRWANPTSDGDRIWDGVANGHRYFTAFSSWASGAPAAGHACGAITTGGRWVSDACSATRGFICEATTNGNPYDLPGPIEQMGKPTPGVCTQPTAFFKDGKGNALTTDLQVRTALAACETAQTAPTGICITQPASQACAEACGGVASVPTGNDCPAFTQLELKDACILKEVPALETACTSDAFCQQLDPRYPTCGKYFACPPEERRNGGVKEETICTSDNVSGIRGFGLVCGVAAPGCPRLTDVDFGSQCGQTEICQDPGYIQEKPDGFKDAAFAAVPFNTSKFFTEPAAPDPKVPFPADDKPCGPNGCANQNENHPWCHLAPANQLPPPQSVAPPKAGDSGGDLVSFVVDPRLRLSYSANIGPFGFPVPKGNDEHGLEVIASAGFGAAVTYDILGGGRLDVVDVKAEAAAHECGIDTLLYFKLFGVDFLPAFIKPIPTPLPSQEYKASCEKAFKALQLAGDRAKKAMRDAATLVAQYQAQLASPSTNDNFHPDTCKELTELAPRGFPKVDCSQGVEAAINGYSEYYRRTIAGFDGLDGAGSELKGIKEAVKDFMASGLNYEPEGKIDLFEIPGRDEEVTIVEFQFFIGPIPVNLEVLSQVNYSALVSLQAGLKPSAIIEQLMLNSTDQEGSRLFYVQANGAPQAGLALAAFAGVGFGVPGFKVKLGIESQLRLANIALPVTAGAGIKLGTDLENERPLGVDLAPPISTGKMLMPPKRFTLRYEYGASLGIQLRKILGGTIKAKLKIKIAFFSKSWSKTLLEFKGICDGEYGNTSGDLGKFPCNVPLISLDGTEKAAEGSFPWGVVRPNTPFVELAQLKPNTLTPGFTGLALKDVQEFFYDGQCTCIPPWNAVPQPDPARECFRDPDCCPGSICFPEPASGKNICTGCRNSAETCYDKFDCCEGTKCFTTGLALPNGKPELKCAACQDLGRECVDNDDCCGYDNRGYGNSCIGGFCKAIGDCDQGSCDLFGPLGGANTLGDEHDCGRGKYDGKLLVCSKDSAKCVPAPGNSDSCSEPK